MAGSIREGFRPSSRRSSKDVPDGHRALQRTPSKASSMFSWRSQTPKETPEEDIYRIVVYDPLERKLWIDTKENLEKTSKYVKVPIRGTETKVSVSMKTGPADRQAEIFIATVDLGRLGKGVKAQRKKKRMQHLYVLGQVPMGFGPVEEEDPEFA